MEFHSCSLSIWSHDCSSNSSLHNTCLFINRVFLLLCLLSLTLYEFLSHVLLQLSFPQRPFHYKLSATDLYAFRFSNRPLRNLREITSSTFASCGKVQKYECGKGPLRRFCCGMEVEKKTTAEGRD